jgi:hypothetical protein
LAAPRPASSPFPGVTARADPHSSGRHSSPTACVGPDGDNYLGGGGHAARAIAANGIRLILEEHRTTETPTLKSGQAGKTKVTYGDIDAALAWLWSSSTGPRRPGTFYRRTLVVFAAERYASQLALPASQRRGSVLPSLANPLRGNSDALDARTGDRSVDEVRLSHIGSSGPTHWLARSGRESTRAGTLGDTPLHGGAARP